MNWNFEKTIDLFSSSERKLLLNGKWGIEREFQRVTKDGELALTPHPAVFGDKLNNKEITTDFSESQMELITPAFSTIEEVYHYLQYLHKKVEKELGNEFIWPFSMPPKLPDEELIPLAQFDESKEGQMAYRYRQGLANRYGKKMQMISGIHFNFSFGDEILKRMKQSFGEKVEIQDFKDELYFSVARNFLRYRWLLIYLFGASPSYDPTYDVVIKKQVDHIRKCCPECCNQYDQYATSFRVSRFGYSNPVKLKESIYYNNKEEYIQGIRALMSKKSRRFSNLEVQLNDKILQKESEFYSPIRLKQVTKTEENQIDALEERGVKYAEVRVVDINPFVKTGISLEQMRFLQIFMLFCLFEENRVLDYDEMNLANKNHHLVALAGRNPNLMLKHYNGNKISLAEWGKEIFGKLYRIAILIDSEENGFVYTHNLLREKQKLKYLSLLPSSRMHLEMWSKGDCFLEFGMRIARELKGVK